MAGDPRKSVIIVGASGDRTRYANKAVRNYARHGYTVYPVHPRETEVEGIRAFATVSEVPGEASTLLLYVRPEVGLEIIDQAPAKGVRQVFVNPGAGSPELLQRIRDLGMDPVEACAILATGNAPHEYPE